MTQKDVMAQIVNRETLVPLGTAVAIIASLFMGYQSLESRLNEIERQIHVVQLSIDDQWSGTDMVIFIQKLKIKNPDLVVPDITEILMRKHNR